MRYSLSIWSKLAWSVLCSTSWLQTHSPASACLELDVRWTTHAASPQCNFSSDVIMNMLKTIYICRKKDKTRYFVDFTAICHENELSFGRAGKVRRISGKEWRISTVLALHTQLESQQNTKQVKCCRAEHSRTGSLWLKETCGISWER